KQIQDSINAIYAEHKANPDFLDEEKTNGLLYRAITIFSQPKKKVVQDQKQIKSLFSNLESHYSQCADLKDLQISQSIKSNLKRIDEANNLIEKTSSLFQSKIENEYDSIDVLGFSTPEYQTEI